MFKGSGQINPQALRNDYSGFERAAAIKQQTLAGIGQAIKEGHQKIVQKKKDAAALESSRVLMEQVAKSAGFEIDPKTLAAIAKGADPAMMKTATETMAKLGQWGQEQQALIDKQEAEKKQRIEAARLLAEARLDAAAPEELREKTEFENKQADRDALSATVSVAAQRRWNLKTTMEAYHRNGGKDDMAAHEAWAKMNPNMRPEVATIEDKDGNEHEVILWNGQMRSIADLTKTERTSAAAEAIEKSDLNPEQKTKLWTKIANLLGSNEDSDSIKALRIIVEGGGAPFVGGDGSNESPEVVNINDL
jgi:hypothetical protein